MRELIAEIEKIKSFLPLIYADERGFENKPTTEARRHGERPGESALVGGASMDAKAFAAIVKW